MPRSEIQRLTSRHQRIAELYLAGMGRSEIAAELAMTPVSITNITQSPLFQSFIARKRAELTAIARERTCEALDSARNDLAHAAKGAIATLESLTQDTEPAGIRLKSASEILSHAFGQDGGNGGKKGVEIGTINVQLLQAALLEANTEAECVEGKLLESKEAEA